jgi:integrase
LKAPGPRRLEVWDTVLLGFGIRVSPTGRKVWFVVVRVGDRQKRFTIGPYPAISLAEAREEVRRIVRKCSPGRAGGAAGARASTYPGRSSSAFHRALRQIQEPQLESLPAAPGCVPGARPHSPARYKRSDVVRVLDQMIAAGTPYRANRALSCLKKLMAWALDRGMVDINPVAGLKPPASERSRERILTDGELGDLVAAADQEGYPFGDLIKLLILTGQRRSEVAEVRWSEIDFEARVWTIPGARTKNKQSHTVPLSAATMDVLRGLPRFLGSDYVFTTTGETPISGFGRAKDRLFAAVEAPDWRIHDLRRTVASGMARLGIVPHVVEKVLNHKSGIISGVAAVYNRYGYDLEKRDALEKWSNALRMLSGKSCEPICQAQFPERPGLASETRPNSLAKKFSATIGR